MAPAAVGPAVFSLVLLTVVQVGHQHHLETLRLHISHLQNPGNVSLFFPPAGTHLVMLRCRPSVFFLSFINTIHTFMQTLYMCTLQAVLLFCYVLVVVIPGLIAVVRLVGNPVLLLIGIFSCRHSSSSASNSTNSTTVTVDVVKIVILGPATLLRVHFNSSTIQCYWVS